LRPATARSIALARSLFATPRAAALTIVVGVPTLALAFVIARFIFAQANWTLITENLRLFYLGTYPIGDEWRVWIPVILLASVGGISYGVSGMLLRRFLYAMGVVAVLLLVLGMEFIPSWLNAVTFGLAIPLGAGWVMTLIVLLVATAMAAVGRLWLIRIHNRTRLITIVSLLWFVPVLVALLLQAEIRTPFGTLMSISPNRWNGLFLDVMVFAVGGVISLPLGILLAIGRVSKFEVIRYSSTAYIEIVRAGPLVVWLILALFLWNDLFFDTNKVHRGMLVFGLFGAAYIAEVVRGGLQSISRGQYEAASSLGLNAFATYTYVIIPQAIRAVIPALVGRFISLWKDTSLLLGLSLINTLEVATAILEGRPANGAFLLEIYLIIALFYWLVSFLLSRLGRYLERSFS
jgi:general L-amino acid transport system permease protein